jgi:hypothetical protein
MRRWGGRRTRIVSDREHKEQIIASHKLIAASIDDPVKRAEYERHFIRELPPKRTYTKRATGSEHQEQSALISWWNKTCTFYGLPHFSLFAIPNGAFFGSGYATAAKLKAEGMRKGILDLMLAVPRDQFHGLFIEMKYGDNRPSEEQLAVKSYLEKAGYHCGVYWSADDAIQAIKAYLA